MIITGEPLDDDQTYLVAINNFLLTGLEQGLGYLTANSPELTVGDDYGDIRQAFIVQLEKN